MTGRSGVRAGGPAQRWRTEGVLRYFRQSRTRAARADLGADFRSQKKTVWMSMGGTLPELPARDNRYEDETDRGACSGGPGPGSASGLRDAEPARPQRDREVLPGPGDRPRHGAPGGGVAGAAGARGGRGAGGRGRGARPEAGDDRGG